MGRIPALTARQIVQALKRAGFEEHRQRGSHLILFHRSTRRRAVVPIHAGRTLSDRLVHAIIRDADLTVDQFLKLL
jgi:predicted RNA binding protein YcfA (HicA-like mRNA interferase family)